MEISKKETGLEVSGSFCKKGRYLEKLRFFPKYVYLDKLYCNLNFIKIPTLLCFHINKIQIKLNVIMQLKYFI